MPKAIRNKHIALFVDELPALLARKFSITAIENIFVEGTSFESDLWRLRFSEKNSVPDKEIDFKVLLYDGSMLTDKANNELLQVFKGLIVYNLLPRFNGGQLLVGATLYYKVLRVLHFIDWVLLNGDYFEITKYRLGLISKRKIQEFLLGVSVGRVWETVYGFTARLKEWLVEKSSALGSAEYQLLVTKQPALRQVVPAQDWILDLDLETLLRGRAWLYKYGYYQKKSGRLYFNASKFIKNIYSGTLHGQSISPLLVPELILEDAYYREFEGVPVRRFFELGYSKTVESQYSILISNLAVVNSEICDSGMSADVARARVSDLQILEVPAKYRDSRYRSVPSSVLLSTLRSAIEFYIKFSKDIFDAIKLCIIYPPREFDRLEMDGRVSSNFRNSLIQLSGWTQKSTLGIPFNYELFRNTPGLCELYAVLVGVATYIIGMTMARRQGELISLRSEDCLEPAKNPYLPENSACHYFMVFDLLKSGSSDRREKVRRAAPLIVAKVLWDFKQFKQFLSENNRLRLVGDKQLFQLLNVFSLDFSPLSSTRHNECLDQMCDFFQTATVGEDEGVVKRYYIRQHQLRRFWAQVFFWVRGSDGLETLSLFLGHTDPEMVYRYVMEELPGSMILDAKYERIVDAVRNKDESVKNIHLLLELLHNEFRAKRIYVKTETESILDLQYSARNGLIQTSPGFDEFCAGAQAESIIENLLSARKIDLNPEFISVDMGDGLPRKKINLILRINK
ncbi:hypothetical protein [Pseudomonas aeruginosa]|uniref:hypothetical protein n=1 Tax=Pseudomonas aeruginosa TaxID=287 RepID=UPI0034588514|nr:hypothetical protein [Pseudomonas aeruginosa]HBO7144027.1 hypothetical protein [Pseudomonas aeruginosa]